MAYKRRLEFNSEEFQEELVRYQNGERENEEALFTAIRIECMQYARNLGKGIRVDRCEPADIAHEACIQLITNKLKTYNTQIGMFGPWLYTVVRSVVGDMKKKSSYKNEHSFVSYTNTKGEGEEVFHQLSDADTGADQLIERKENKKQAQTIIDKLTETERMVLIETKWYGKSVKETGESMGRTGNWASGVLHTGRKKIANELSKLAPGEWPGLEMAA